MDKRASDWQGRSVVYDGEYVPLTAALVDRLAGEGIPREDLEFLQSEGFMYCTSRHSFFRVEAGAYII